MATHGSMSEVGSKVEDSSLFKALEFAGWILCGRGSLQIIAAGVFFCCYLFQILGVPMCSIVLRDGMVWHSWYGTRWPLAHRSPFQCPFPLQVRPPLQREAHRGLHPAGAGRRQGRPAELCGIVRQGAHRPLRCGPPSHCLSLPPCLVLSIKAGTHARWDSVPKCQPQPDRANRNPRNPAGRRGSPNFRAKKEMSWLAPFFVSSDASGVSTNTSLRTHRSGGGGTGNNAVGIFCGRNVKNPKKT